jgi:tetratricopeptide (TPR) repeat protein
MGMVDNAIAWTQRIYMLKPLYYNGVMQLSLLLYHKGRHQEALEVIDHYLRQVKINPDAWLMAVNLHRNVGQREMALILLDSAKKWLPADTAIIRQWNLIHKAAQVNPLETFYDSARMPFIVRR